MAAAGAGRKKELNMIIRGFCPGQYHRAAFPAFFSPARPEHCGPLIPSLTSPLLHTDRAQLLLLTTITITFLRVVFSFVRNLSNVQKEVRRDWTPEYVECVCMWRRQGRVGILGYIILTHYCPPSRQHTSTVYVDRGMLHAWKVYCKVLNWVFTMFPFKRSETWQ